MASFFISRVDTEIDRRLDEIGTPEALDLRGKGAVAQARLAYRLFRDTFSGDRWDISPDGQLVVRQIADRIADKCARRPDLVVTVAGYTADPPDYSPQRLARLGQARSDSVADALRAADVTCTVRSIGGGKAPDMTAIVNGAFNDALAALR